MTIPDLEAKLRKAKPDALVMVQPKLILQLIEERRLLARLTRGLMPNEYADATALRDRVLQEIAECKS